jgi:hypothetical protein
MASVLTVATAMAGTVEPIVTTVAKLREEGIIVRRTSLDTPGASNTIEVSTENHHVTGGTFTGAECVVLKEDVTASRLSELDAASMQEGQTTRRSQTTKAETSFIVLGKEISRAYLAFNFSLDVQSGEEHQRRYLLPVTAIKRRRAE